MAGRKKVLWVDDEIEFLRSHIMFLETRGYSVIPVFSGDDAIHLIQQDPQAFDIVLLDEQMPGKDGLTTLEEIKEMLPDLPVVMVTKSEEERVMEDALGMKIDGYLTKPVNPSQILLICKRLLDSKQIISSQIKQKFIRSYSDIRTQISGRMSTSQWAKLHENLAKWDIELENEDDEGLRQTHAGQKSDCNSNFSEYIVENYAQWVKGASEPPVMSPKVIEQYVAPLLKEKKQVVFIVMSGMRLDQYLGIETVLRQFYAGKRTSYYSILPTSTNFARPSLFAGKLPGDISAPIWKTGDETTAQVSEFEQQLLGENLVRLGFTDVKNPLILTLTDTTDTQSVLSEMNAHAKDRMITIVVDFVELLSQHRSTSSLLQEMAPDEHAFRTLTNAWFQHSSLLQILKELSKRECTVVLTSDHGSVLCSRGTEIYGVENIGANLRFKFGENITADERRVVNLADPMHFKLPRFSEIANCVVARENYYFIHPEKFEHYQKQYQNSFQQGGISMDEVIVPLVILTPNHTSREK